MKVGRIYKGNYCSIELNDIELKKASDEYEYDIMTDKVKDALYEKNLTVPVNDFEKIVLRAIEIQKEYLR